MQITATLGPASLGQDILGRLIKKVSRLRINSAHVGTAALRQILRDIPSDVPLVVDLQGAKVRIGGFPDSDRLPERVFIKNLQESSNVNQIPLPDTQFFRALRAGDRIFLNDAKVELELVSTDRDIIEAVVIKNGPLSSFKGINRKEHPVPFMKVSDADRRAIGASLKHPNVQYAVSFVLNGEEAKLFRPLVRDKRLIAKIERPEAVADLPNIQKNFDELWFCRGDMGSQAGVEKLPTIQEEFLSASSGHGAKPRFIAGRLLWSMIEGRVPSKAELEYLSSLKGLGFDGLVLSDETAVGVDPLGVVELLSAI